jgi:mannose/cellobiose epimerase-like protein (N-acyl-D-glucosamine 2-epimerase family)
MIPVENASAAAAICETLKEWLIEDAYPIWWAHGVDRIHGGYHERLGFDGSAIEVPRRARLHPRQMYAFSVADDLGWPGPGNDAVRHGYEFFAAHYRRPDGLYRALVAPDGSSLTQTAVLYDQAFALLGLAAVYDALGQDHLRQAARELHDVLRDRLAHPLTGFDESSPRKLPLLSNSHMHLLEAALAWMELDHEPRWRQLAAEIVELALHRFIEPSQGFIREYFDGVWGAAPGIEGRIIEPGHQFEWAWLLLRWSAQSRDERAAAAALRLIELGETRCIDAARGVALNALLTSGAVHDARARLWPQAERLKAACIAAHTTREPQYWDMAVRAAQGVMKYLGTPIRGLWYDTMHPDGTFTDESVPASSLYHIVSAIAELDCIVNRAVHVARTPESRSRLAHASCR